jgi:hypothetical protein
MLRARGIQTSYLRIRALPLEATLTDFLARYERVYIVELNQPRGEQRSTQHEQRHGEPSAHPGN